MWKRSRLVMDQQRFVSKRVRSGATRFTCGADSSANRFLARPWKFTSCRRSPRRRRARRFWKDASSRLKACTAPKLEPASRCACNLAIALETPRRGSLGKRLASAPQAPRILYLSNRRMKIPEACSAPRSARLVRTSFGSPSVVKPSLAGREWCKSSQHPRMRTCRACAQSLTPWLSRLSSSATAATTCRSSTPWVDNPPMWTSCESK
mmetsp:Transcript_7021/g.25625  ORF Transcript_7021/g.25625 Transcript_7021/m.25625 type:complete len:208 (+) Transcript_7021:14750-15373(+)